MPRHSSGCRQCVRRKVKCDTKQPFCARCERAGIPCDGPPASGAFLVETKESIEFKTKLKRPFFKHKRTELTPAPPRAIITLSPSPDRAMELQYCSSFIENHYNTGSRSHPYQDNKYWMVLLLHDSQEHPMTSLALRALVNHYVGRIMDIQDLKVLGAKLYGRALLAVRKQIETAQVVGGFDLLAASPLLCMYEVVTGSSPDGWSYHAEGLHSLLTSQTPKFFTTNKSTKALFAMSRAFIVIDFFWKRKRCYLEKPEWSGILDSEDPDAKKIIRMYDFGTKVPGLMEDTDSLIANHESYSRASLEAQVYQLQAQWLGLLTEVQRWHDEWQSSPSHLPKEISVALMSNNIRELLLKPPFESMYSYSSVEIAHTECEYQALVILIQAQYHKLRSRDWQKSSPFIIDNDEHVSPQWSDDRSNSSNSTDSGHDARPPLNISRNLHHAREICKSVSYFLTSEYATSGVYHMIFSAKIAWKALPVGSAERAWLTRILVQNEKSAYGQYEQLLKSKN